MKERRSGLARVKRSRAAGVCREIAAKVPDANLTSVSTGTPSELAAALEGRVLVIAAGASGIVLLPRASRLGSPTFKQVIDLKAVPPQGLEGVDVTDKAARRDGMVCYGAIGIGGTKMKIHKAAIAKLFESNDQVMDAEEVYQIAQALG